MKQIATNLKMSSKGLSYFQITLQIFKTKDRPLDRVSSGFERKAIIYNVHIDQERTRARLSKQEMLGKANTHFAQNNVTTNDSNRVTFIHGGTKKRGATVIITISRKYQLRKMWCSNKLFFLISKFTSSNRCYRDFFVLQNIPVRCF